MPKVKPVRLADEVKVIWRGGFVAGCNHEKQTDDGAGQWLRQSRIQRAWLLDWLTASYLPRFNQKGMLRVVRNAGLGRLA